MAHLLELRAKMLFAKDDYQLVQGIYRGWQWLGIFEIGAIVLTLGWTIMVRKEIKFFRYALSALLCLIISIIIFFVFTFPANQATTNWTNLPSNWEELRMKWEYSHAARALLNLTGFMLLIAGVLQRKNRRLS